MKIKLYLNKTIFIIINLMEFKEIIYKVIDNQIEKLELEHLNKQNLNKLCNALKFNHSLKTIYLEFCEIEEEDLTSLCKVLQNNPYLEELELSDVELEDIDPLFKFLINTSCLKKLKLFYIKIRKRKIREEEEYFLWKITRLKQIILDIY